MVNVPARCHVGTYGDEGVVWFVEGMAVGSDQELFHPINNCVSHRFVVSKLRIEVEMQKLRVVIKASIENNDCIDSILL